MDFRTLRDALRRERERANLTLDQLADRSGLNRATIHSIENIKREPDLRPELETIERLVVALGLTLADFFAHVERSPNSPLSPPELGATTASLPHEAAGGADNPVSSGDRFFLERLAAACLRAADAAGRDTTRAMLEELSVGFGLAADPTLGRDTARGAVRQARATRRPKKSGGERG